MHKEFINEELFNTYLVGGAVRDRLLGKPEEDIKDMDYVVEPKLGVSVEEIGEYLESLGFVGVGNDFPVYKKDDIDIALPRTEKKVGKGYSGFKVETEGVSIYEDLLRRDLTINSIAYNVVTGEYIEPFGVNAIQDLKDGKLRPTSKAFLEDPLRFVRLARMSSKMPDFEIVYDEFSEMLTTEVKQEIKMLSQERIVMEIIKVLETNNPSNFFRVLKELDILDIVLADINKMVGKEQSLIHHAEGDVFEHTMYVLDEISKATKDPMIKFGALLHDVGKAYTYEQTVEDGRDIKEAYYGHEAVELIDSIFSRYKSDKEGDLKFPSKYVEFAAKSAKMHHLLHNAENLNPKNLTKIMLDKSLITNRKELEGLIIVAKGDAHGRIAQKTNCTPEELSQQEVVTVFKEGKIKKGKSLMFKGELVERTDYGFFLELYDFMDLHRDKYTVTKELILSGKINGSNGKLDIELKEKFIYENALRTVKTFKQQKEKKRISMVKP